MTPTPQRTPWRTLLLFGAAAFVLRLVLVLLFTEHPGVDDSLHYYNLGRRLAQGQGFTIDYVWQYLRLYDSVVHPIDYWMPLSGMIAGGSMALLGITPLAGKLPFLLLGSLLPALSYALARHYGLERRTGLYAAALTIALPELVWQSTRLLTTTPNMILLGGSILLLLHGLRRERWLAYMGSGALAGLAYLNRTDSLLLLPALVLTLAIYALWGRKAGFTPRRWSALLLLPLVAVLVVLPWMLRNQAVLGQTGMVENSRIFFMVEYTDHHSYDNARITPERLLAERSIGELLAKRAFEFAAALKQIVVSLQLPGALLVTAGGLLLLWRRNGTLLLGMLPALLLLLGILVAYPLLIPMKSQGGSFRTAFASLLPLLLPLAAYGLQQLIHEKRLQVLFLSLLVLFSVGASADMMRLESALINNYHAFVQDIVRQSEELPDVTGDGEVRLMLQDPLILSYYGQASVIVPKGSREEIIAAAQHYGVDYILLPTGWTDLDSFHGRGASDDPRFVFSAALPLAGRLPAEFYAIRPENAVSGER